MTKIRIAALAASVTLAAFAGPVALAQEKADEMFVYASYFTCPAGLQADNAMETAFKSVYDGAVKDGSINGWAWLQHHTGGSWTRLGYHTASSQKAVMQAGETLNERTSGEAFESANKQFNQACRSHEDYIWRRVAGNVAPGARGKSSMSVYYVCDSARERQADAVVKHVFAPVFDKLVAEGKLASWGWLEHVVGGKYRRLATMSAADLGTLMDARAAVMEATKDEPLGDVFNDVCGSHQDYIWNVAMQTP